MVHVTYGPYVHVRLGPLEFALCHVSSLSSASSYCLLMIASATFLGASEYCLNSIV